eukprot:TRINITY_DN7219_c0_g2_i10.p1 TRINITY_DN7219_c0_g2~~TRINITY_DN7219_c0_g2_i10.p1  ORF type:complete len:282 (+),score=43.80 TRINITY_DN7219_c0_g2_i10:250-1095(+)
MIAGVTRAKPGALCGFVSAGSFNFFAICSGIESPLKVAQCIKAGSTNAISMRTLRDAQGTIGEGLGSVESVQIGVSVTAIQWQTWGRSNFIGPVVGLKLGALLSVLFPSKFYLHARMTVTRGDGHVEIRESRFSWIIITGRHPFNGAQDSEGTGWVSFIDTQNACWLPRFLKTIDDPIEFLGGTARMMQETLPFDKLEIEPLNADENGIWPLTCDGELVRCTGTVTIQNSKGAATLLTPETMGRDPAFVRPPLNPVCQGALDTHLAFGGEPMPIERGCSIM